MFDGVRCPSWSSADDRVVDSRTVVEGVAIRRRRECLSCGQRFTTYERLEELPLQVTKRSGHREPFDRRKIIAGVRSAAKNRPISFDQMEALALDVEERMKMEGHEVTSQQVGRSVLERLGELDEVAYLRFASVYKGFADLGDFQREVGRLAKTTAPKPRS
jgi:transcriptional repressor NrdR